MTAGDRARQGGWEPGQIELAVGVDRPGLGRHGRRRSGSSPGGGGGGSAGARSANQRRGADWNRPGARAHRMLTTPHSHSELPARPPLPRPAGDGDRDGAGASAQPHLHAQRPRLLTLRPPRLLLSRVAAAAVAAATAAVPAPLVLHAASSRPGDGRRRSLLLRRAPREAAFSPFKNKKTKKKTTALPFPRRPPHKLRRTPPTSGSVGRRHAAQA